MSIFATVTQHFPPAKITGYKGGYPRINHKHLPTKKNAQALTENLILTVALDRLTAAPRNQSDAQRKARADGIVAFMATELAAAN